jgi:photosystem II stability/assembly factor-like uncharacterized protein
MKQTASSLRRLALVVRAVVITATLAGFATAPTTAAASSPAPMLNPGLPAEQLESATTSAILGSQHAGNRIVSVGEHGIILLSDDSGKTFRQAALVPTRTTLTSLYFANEMTGWAVGHWGVILRTDDGGEHWTVQRSDINVDRPLFSVYFKSQTEGWAVGLWSLMLHTVDGGKTWGEVKLPVPAGATKADANLYAITGSRAGPLYIAAERGLVVKSTDGGATWSYSETGFKGSLWAVAVLKDSAIMVGGLRGGMLRSEDEGNSWASIQTQHKNSITGIEQNPDGSITAVGLDGLQLTSHDDGVTFSGIQRPDRATITVAVPLAKGGPLLFSAGGPLTAE